VKLPFPLQENERVLLVCRRHWLYFWPRIAAYAVAALLPVIALFLLLRWAGALDGIAVKIALVASAVWLAVWAVKAFFNWYRYNNDIWTITDQRIIDSFRSGPFSLKMTTADLVDIVDTAMQRSGILATLLDFGDIRCETAGERQDISLPAVPHPSAVHALIDKERDRERRNVYHGDEVTQSAPAQPAD
jgi:membrane protein YdbS with pleckstrin-like domain